MNSHHTCLNDKLRQDLYYRFSAEFLQTGVNTPAARCGGPCRRGPRGRATWRWPGAAPWASPPRRRRRPGRRSGPTTCATAGTRTRAGGSRRRGGARIPSRPRGGCPAGSRTPLQHLVHRRGKRPVPSDAAAVGKEEEEGGVAAAAAGHGGMEFLVSCLPPPLLSGSAAYFCFVYKVFTAKKNKGFGFICSSLVLDAHALYWYTVIGYVWVPSDDIFMASVCRMGIFEGKITSTPISFFINFILFSVGLEKNCFLLVIDKN
jgi:hypothetical protein